MYLPYINLIYSLLFCVSYENLTIERIETSNKKSCRLIYAKLQFKTACMSSCCKLLLNYMNKFVFSPLYHMYTAALLSNINQW